MNFQQDNVIPVALKWGVLWGFLYIFFINNAWLLNCLAFCMRLKDNTLQKLIELNGVELVLLGSMVMWFGLMWMGYKLWKEEKNKKELDLEDDSVILDS